MSRLTLLFQLPRSEACIGCATAITTRLYSRLAALVVVPFRHIVIRSATLAILACAVVPMSARAEKVNVFLVGGQSNADGRAPMGDLPQELLGFQDDVAIHWAIANNGSSTLKASGYSLLRPGFSNSTGSFGPEVTFGRGMADFYAARGERVALIKHAQGGTSIANHWQAGGDGTTTGDGYVYELFQDVVSSGMTNIQGAYPPAGEEPMEVSIAGMIWMQGEADSNTTSTAAAYEANLTDFITDVRATYGADLPFVIGQLSVNQTGTNGSDADREVVRAAQAAVANSLPNTELLVTDTFGLKSDNLHFNASGQQDLGYGFATEMQSLLEPATNAQSARFDFGGTSGLFDQNGWTTFDIDEGSLSPLSSQPDPATGWTVAVVNPVNPPDDNDGDVGSRERDPFDASIGGTFTLDDVYVDFIVGWETLTIGNLDPTEKYDVQLIMFDDNASDGRTQTVTNITDGASDVLGTSAGPGGGSSLMSDLDYSVFGTGLSPDGAGDLVLEFANSATGDRSLLNGLIISVAEPSALSGDFNGDNVVNVADYAVWRDNLGADESILPPGTGDNSGVVDAGDYLEWKNNFGATWAASSTLGGKAVPEPGSLVMLSALGLAVVLDTRAAGRRRTISGRACTLLD